MQEKDLNFMFNLVRKDTGKKKLRKKNLKVLLEVLLTYHCLGDESKN